MSWIKTVPYADAPPALRKLYDRVKGPDGYIDNILLVHGLRPHTLQGHMMLYKNVLHHQGNALEKWLLESIGVLVSHLNACTYCVEHHFAGLRKLLNDDTRAINIRDAIETQNFALAFTAPEALLLDYVVTLTTSPDAIGASQIDALRQAGFDDGKILEANQVASYFAYANRTVLGLGVSLKNDILGLSPGDSSDPENWSHA